MRFQYKALDGTTYPMEIRVHHTRPPKVIATKWPEGATISVNIGNTVAVTSLDKMFENAGILYGHTGRPSNGVTNVTLGVRDGDRWHPLVTASASCSQRDQFCKRTGRELALSRLLDEVLHKDERLGEALGLFLTQRGWR